jgi:hypothetical protein
MSFAEILEELPKLSENEKRKLFDLLVQELDIGEQEHPEVVAAIDKGLKSLEVGEPTYTLEEARQRVKNISARARR